MRAYALAVCGVLLWIGSTGVCWGATCTVPSGIHPTIQAAVDDTGCTEIELAGQTYAESVDIGRSLSLSGVSSATSIIAGQVGVTGAATVVSLADLTVDGAGVAVAGCFAAAVSAGGGAQVLAGNLVVLNAVGSGCPLFGDGFESGSTGAWSAVMP